MLFVTTAPASTERAAAMIVRRTYETFDIQFEGGATWSGYPTEAEAVAVLAGCSRPGRIARRTFHADFEAGSRLLEISRRDGAPAISEEVLP